jgi:MerR family copper efflux transcriptional regulator
MNNKQYAIGFVAKQFGITTVALRHYQKIGLLEPEHRSPSGYRLYGDQDLARLGFLLNAKNAGFTLDEIKILFEIVDKKGLSTAVKQLVKQKLDSIDAQITNLKKLKVTLSQLDRICQKQVAAKDCPIVQHLRFP